jgi:hypoxanthine phosphoribosyltransferase
MPPILTESSVTASMPEASSRFTETSRPWSGPPLRTLQQPAFEAACALLMRLVEADYAPTLIIGIRTGGWVVAEAMVRARAMPLPVLPLTCRRPGTNTKTRVPLLRTAVASLPRPVADLTRRLEHRWFSARRLHQHQPQNIDRAEAEAIKAWLRKSTQPARILVADDAVDSGVTLQTVLQALREVGRRGMELRSAAITQTLAQPHVTPNYVLWRDTLCRFPWSLDA